MRFLGSVVVTALALWLTALVLPGMQLGTGQGLGAVLALPMVRYAVAACSTSV